MRKVIIATTLLLIVGFHNVIGAKDNTPEILKETNHFNVRIVFDDNFNKITIYNKEKYKEYLGSIFIGELETIFPKAKFDLVIKSPNDFAEYMKCTKEISPDDTPLIMLEIGLGLTEEDGFYIDTSLRILYNVAVDNKNTIALLYGNSYDNVDGALPELKEKCEESLNAVLHFLRRYIEG